MISRKFMDYIGDISQIGGIKRYMFTSGKAKGVEAYDVNNGNGLLYTVIADRGLDIYHLSFKGIPISFISKPVFSDTFFLAILAAISIGVSMSIILGMRSGNLICISLIIAGQFEFIRGNHSFLLVNQYS